MPETVPPDVAEFMDRRGLVRFRQRTDPDHPDYDPRFLPIVTAMARGEPTPPRPPSLMRQAVTFGNAVVRHIRGGMRRVSPEAEARRKAICRECDRLSAGRCLECGCVIAIKTGWPGESCPLGKWTTEAPAGRCGGCGGKS